MKIASLTHSKKPLITPARIYKSYLFIQTNPNTFLIKRF